MGIKEGREKGRERDERGRKEERERESCSAVRQKNCSRGVKHVSWIFHWKPTLDFLILTEIEGKRGGRKERKEEETYCMKHYINGNLRVFFFFIICTPRRILISSKVSLVISKRLIKYSTILFSTKKKIYRVILWTSASIHNPFFLSLSSSPPFPSPRKPLLD